MASVPLSQYLPKVRAALGSGLGMPLGILALLGLITIPLPPFLLDLFFSFNIALSLVVLVVAAYVRKPLDFAVFPTVILVTTLFRLSLNIASTRVILMEGHQGPGAAGEVIESFGEFVIGGNYAVGLVIFAILVVINFVVITKGAGRVAEVSARFTLDSMPGKQMAIDADLNAGLITQEEAQKRRQEVALEADFYGAMDGASKFVRGDAVAGIVILFINVIGGLAIGMAQHGLPFGQAVETYTLLTIGDGLVAQIPSLLLSVATAIVITRVSKDENDMGRQLQAQLLQNPRVLTVTAGILIVMGLIPGMPNLAFLAMGAAIGAGAWRLWKQQREAAAEPASPERDEGDEQASAEQEDVSWDDVEEVNPISLELGYRLLPLVDRQQKGTLLDRIRGVRRKLSQELGFLIPPVHIHDNLEFEGTHYCIRISGVIAGEGDVHPDKMLAINPGEVFGEIQGIPTRDPAFGMEALWISPSDQDQAQAMGYMVVDAETVIATHLSHLIQEFAWQLLGPDEVQTLLDRIKTHSPKLVEELTPDKLPLSTLVRVLQNLLKDRVPIRDMRTILRTLNEYADRVKDADELTGYVRVALGRAIVEELVDDKGALHVITLNPNLEQILLQAAQNAPDGQLLLEPGIADQLFQSLNGLVDELEAQGIAPVLLVSPQIRGALANLFRSTLPKLYVLAWNEIPDNRKIEVVATVGQPTADGTGE